MGHAPDVNTMCYDSPRKSKLEVLEKALNSRCKKCSNTLVTPKKTRNLEVSSLCERCEPDLNRRITVLQTGALPLGYRTIYEIF